jgi:hypothetical protein
MAKKKFTRRHTPVAKLIAANPEQPVNSRQCAEHLQITTRTLAAWRANGIGGSKIPLPYMRINPRNFRYRIRDVEAALSLAS